MKILHFDYYRLASIWRGPTLFQLGPAPAHLIGLLDYQAAIRVRVRNRDRKPKKFWGHCPSVPSSLTPISSFSETEKNMNSI